MRRMLRRMVGTLLALATILGWPVFASDYPNKPIKVISDSAPGSAVDVSFRMVMDRLGSVLGQQIAPIDQPGAGGAIAARAASESIPDGYTLFAPALSLFISLPGKARKPAADLAARFPSRRFAGTVVRFYMRKPAIRHQNAAGLDCPRQRASGRNRFC